MLFNYNYLYVTALLVLTSVYARAGAPERVTIELRVVANRPRNVMVVRLDNSTRQDVRFGEFMDIGVSWFVYDRHANRDSSWRTVYGGHRPDIMTLQAGESLEWDIHDGLFLGHAEHAYSRWKWHGVPLDPPPDVEIAEPSQFLIGYVPVDGGPLQPPYVDADSGAASNLLAFVFHQNMRGGIPIEDAPPNELAFLLLNGTDASKEIAPPLSGESILHMSAPAIGYSAEITLTDSGFEAKTIPPGESGQWRIPFERILEQIPAETIEAIRAADGALDVVWKDGDRESPPLPLILLPPTQAELDAAFLAEHANVPRIDENTDLSLDLRLAGIESEPVLLGRLRNNEPHTVLWDEKARTYSMFRPSPLFGISFDYTRFGYGWRPNLIEPGETIKLKLTLEKYSTEQRKQRDVISKGGFVMAGKWEFFNDASDLIWMALPGDENQVSAIHAFDASWHRLTTLEVHQGVGRPSLSGIPDLPPIAPFLAYVHNSEAPPELTCVLWNRTEEAINVTDSRIIASAPAADYRHELPLPAGLDLPATVAPGAHTDWRIPWSAIMDQIPPNDLARIKAAGGELDLIWHVNGLDSPPLPLLLGWDGQAE